MMPRSPRRTFLDGLDFVRPRGPRAPTPPDSLVTIAQCLANVDLLMVYRLEQYEAFPPARVSIDERTLVAIRTYCKWVRDNTSHTSSSEGRLRSYLADTTCLSAWSLVFNSLIENVNWRGKSYWPSTKLQAGEILDAALPVLEIYDTVGVAEACSLAGVSAGIEAKLDKLALFDDAFSIRVHENDGVGSTSRTHPFSKALSARRARVQAASAARRLSGHANRDATLVAMTVIAITVSALPISLAYHLSTTNTRGSTTDPDFWLLVQNSLMQILGLTTTMLVSLISTRGIDSKPLL
ncbi:MAG: hypothetical protein LQ341_003924 [Variospora aurantia]|nr:MAG: hypothetical protein LQ341_003924 [Variospora aurantia]